MPKGMPGGDCESMRRERPPNIAKASLVSRKGELTSKNGDDPVNILLTREREDQQAHWGTDAACNSCWQSILRR